MNVAVIGSGGREHAICESLIKSKKIKKLYCLPGNGGTESIAQNINIDLSNFKEIKDFVKKNKINLVVVGPEKPLVEGINDYLEKNKIKVFGPNKFASQLEGSKIFTKKICKKYKIPTANFVVKQNIKQSLEHIRKAKFPLIIKGNFALRICSKDCFIFCFITKFAVGILYFLQIFFVKILEPSSWEANLFGPNTLILFFSK